LSLVAVAVALLQAITLTLMLVAVQVLADLKLQQVLQLADRSL
jgi:hypothetical protein